MIGDKLQFFKCNKSVFKFCDDIWGIFLSRGYKRVPNDLKNDIEQNSLKNKGFLFSETSLNKIQSIFKTHLRPHFILNPHFLRGLGVGGGGGRGGGGGI